MGKKFHSIVNEMEKLISGDDAYSIEPQDYIANIGEFVHRLREDALDGVDEETCKLIKEHSNAIDLLESSSEVFKPLDKIFDSLSSSEFLNKLADSIENRNGCMWIANSTTCRCQIAYGHCSGKCLNTCVTYQNIADRLRNIADKLDRLSNIGV